MTTAFLPTAAGLWYRDVISCLWATLAENIARAGGEPLDVLGLHWEFRFRPGDVRSEEFYFAGAHPDDVARSIAPYHGISSRWHRAAADDDPLAELAELTGRGMLPVAAVDNFHLPFRPAYGDVHAAHLIVVHDVDLAAGTVTVSDAMPPAFSGVIDAAAFRRSWESANPSDEQDAFFSDSRIDRRYLTVTVGELPPLDRGLLKRALAADGERFAAGDERGPSGDWTGLPGLRRFLDDLREGAAAGEPGALRDAYPFGWGMQAQAGLHGELLRRLGVEHDVPELREAGRRVEAVAHAWTGVRLCAAHGHPDPRAALRELHGHAARLEEAYHQGVAAVHDAWRAL
ncbi:BtrH N-terminal domain-containing protein [Streptomyces seoulensis]